MGINKKAVFKFWLAFLIVSAFFLSTLIRTQTASAAAGINSQLSFEGKIVKSDGTNISDGTYNMEFKIYQDGNNQGVGSTLKWTEDWLVGGSGGISLTSGTFQVNLGAHNPFASQVDWNQDTLWLSMQIGNSSSCTISTTFQSNCSGDGEMKPYIRLTAVPYAQNSASLSGLTAGNFVQMAQGLQTDSSTTNASISINKTNASGTPDILLLQKSGKNVVEVNNSGTVLLGQAGASGLNGTLTFNNSAGTNTVSLSLQANPGSSYTLLLPTTGPNVSQCLQTDAATANQLVFNACSTGGSGATSVAYSTTSNANGGSISGSVLTLAKADGSNPGLLSADAQIIGGDKTFAGGLLSQTPTSPTYLGGSDPTGSGSGTVNVNSVFISGKYAYVATAANFSTGTCSTTSIADCDLQIYDISNPANPVFIGGVDAYSGNGDSTGFSSVFVSGGIAYLNRDGAVSGSCVSGTRAGCELQIFDVSNPRSPKYFGGYDGGNFTNFSSVYVIGRVAYVYDTGNDKILAFDISNPVVPALISSFTDSGTDKKLYAQGKLVFTASSSGQSRILDASNPSSISSLYQYTGLSATSVFVSGRYEYLTQSGNSGTCSSSVTTGCELVIYDISDPTNPVYKGGIDSSTGSGTDTFNSVYVAGRYAYAAKNADSGTCSSTIPTGCETEIIDVSDPTNPIYKGGIDNGGTADNNNTVFASGSNVAIGKVGNSGTCSSSVATGCEFQIYDAPGVNATNLVSGTIDAGALQIRNDAFVNNSLSVSNGLSVGNGLMVGGGLTLNQSTNNANGNAFYINPGFTSSTSTLSYSALEIGSFSPTNSAGFADNINGIKVDNLTDPGTLINSTAINFGTGWDTLIGGTTAGTYYINFGSFQVTSSGAISAPSLTSSASLSLQSGGTSAVNMDTAGNAAINIGSTNATSMVLGGNTSATITQKVANSSTTAFQLQTAGGTKYLVADTTGVALKVGGGDVTADATPVILVLDHKSAASGSTDPTGTNGGMYYNESLNKLRCFENSAWVNCITNAASTLYGFAGSTAAATKATTTYYAVGSGTASTTRTNQEIKLAAGGTLKNLNVYIVSNSTTGQTNTVQVYINGAATGPSITFTTATGWLSDTTNTATVNVGDTLTFALTNGGSGGGTINIVMGSASVSVQ